MKKLLALLVVCFMLMTMLSSCQLKEFIAGLFNPTPPACEEHVDANEDLICDNCGATLESPEPPHTEHVDENEDYICDVCEATLERPAPPAVLVSGIIVSTDDEDGEGTEENPYKVTVAQGNSIEIPYLVQPNNADDKSMLWSAPEGSGLTLDDQGNKLVVSAAADGTSATIKGVTNDASDIEVYISVTVQEYNPVEGIAASGLLASSEEGIDYVFETALGTSWDMTAGILHRGQELLSGNIFGGMQAPRNLTYFPTLQNFGLTVAPENATDPTILISYTDDSVFKLESNGTWTALKAGETVITVSSYTEPDVLVKIKVIVNDSLYRGITLDAFNTATVSVNTKWNLDADHGTEAQFARYDDWHLVMVHSNEVRGGTGIDNNQKIFYMGSSDRPYGICLENNVGSQYGAGALNESASLMWAKLAIPEGAVTFNVKIGNNDKVHGQYRVVFVEADGTQTVLTNGWVGFTNGPSESTQKLVLPDAIKGKTGAMVIEHRVTEADNNAELQVKVMEFEGQVDVTGVNLDKSEGKYKPGQSFTLKGSVSPSNATNDKVIYVLGADAVGNGITLDAATGAVTVGEDTPAGVYHLYALSHENPDIKAEYTLTVTVEEIEVNVWNGKSEILDGVSDVKWVIDGKADLGVGEGADIKIDGNEWSALVLDGRKIKETSFILTFGARVFHRDGETYPKFVVKVNGEVVRGIGQSEDWFYVDTDATQYCSYDLSKWIGQTVKIEIGITQGTHAVVQHISFKGTTAALNWANKSELKDESVDPWVHTGDCDAGVGEGYDIMHTGSTLYNSFLIGEYYNSQFTFGARVFHRDGETYPEIKLIVTDASGVEHLIRANGVDADTVYVDTDATQRFTYDLSAFAGQEVKIAITLDNNATHCVITDISMAGAAE